MPRLLALLALLMLPPVALGQDTEDDSGDTASTGDGAVAVSGDEGGRPACACSPGLAGLPLAPTLILGALVVRRRR